MEPSEQAHVLVVAHKTAATPALLAAVRERAARGPARFSLVVPNPVDGLGPGGHQLEWKRTEGAHVLALALPLMEEAAGAPVDGFVATDPSPYDAVEEVVKAGRYDEMIVSTLPHPVSHWLHIDLPGRLAHLGLPITTIVAQHEAVVASD